MLSVNGCGNCSFNSTVLYHNCCGFGKGGQSREEGEKASTGSGSALLYGLLLVKAADTTTLQSGVQQHLTCTHAAPGLH
jgi:hypothetical protein